MVFCDIEVGDVNDAAKTLVNIWIYTLEVKILSSASHCKTSMWASPPYALLFLPCFPPTLHLSTVICLESALSCDTLRIAITKG